MKKSEILQIFDTLRIQLQNISEKDLNDVSTIAYQNNLWFTKDSILRSIAGMIAMLEPKMLEKWIENYQINHNNPKKIGVIMAGNIPFVGFHDAICVIASGHILYAKLSSNDKILPTFILNLLKKIDPRLESKIIITDKLNDIEALVATGTDNSARYFEYYFAKIPRIIRKSRTSLAIIDGTETKENFTLLGEDIFSYFGHGCRNVSSVLVPQNYKLDTFFEAMLPFGETLLNNNKYCNNYDYHKAIFLMNMDKFLDNNFLMLRESSNVYSPISVVHYHRYIADADIENYISSNTEKIQCIVATKPNKWTNITFGQAQNPTIFDYADGIDVMDFLKNI